MSSNMKVDIEQRDSSIFVKIEGSINEDADFSQLRNLKGEVIEFDLGGVTLMNSCGIREWIEFIESLGGGVNVVYHRCPQIIVEQMNMVKGFIPPNGKITSFFAPYFSEKEDEVKQVLIKSEEVINMKAPQKFDPESGEELEFDDIEEQYFSFLSNL